MGAKRLGVAVEIGNWRRVMTEKCTVMIGGWGGYHCGKQAKGKLKNGQPACGVHLHAEKIRNENNKKRTKELEDNKIFRIRMMEIANKISLEIKINESNKSVIINEKEFIRLAKLLMDLKKIHDGNNDAVTDAYRYTRELNEWFAWNKKNERTG